MGSNKYTFRFDDVCLNSNMNLLYQLTDFLINKFPDCKIIWAISPVVYDSQREQQRVFPKMWNAISDFRVHYKLNRVGLPIPHRNERVIYASHGLIHCDHRLMHRSAQELSIILSSKIIGASIFVPPFNKWNKDTADICKENGIELVRFEDGWHSLEHADWDSKCLLWYLHAREWTLDSLKKWFV